MLLPPSPIEPPTLEPPLALVPPLPSSVPPVAATEPPVPPDAGMAPVLPELPLVRRCELPPQATKNAVTMSAEAPTRMGGF
jgi:hypothetical protein